MLIAELIFLANQLQDPSFQREMRIPLEFVAFAFTEGQLYTHHRNTDTFVMPRKDGRQRWGNDVVYGGLFLLNDFMFYSRLLDAYHVCSLSTLLKNHNLDVHHRVKREVTPIHFADLDSFSRLKYVEVEPLNVTMYVGNQNHPKINQRLYKQGNPHRIVNGVDAEHYKQLYREVHTT